MSKTWTETGHHKQIIIRTGTLVKIRKIQAKLYVKEGKKPSYTEIIERLLEKSGGKI